MTTEKPSGRGKKPLSLPPLESRDPRLPHCPPPEKVDVRVPDLPSDWAIEWPGKPTDRPRLDYYPRLLIRSSNMDDGNRPLAGDTGHSPGILAKAANGAMHQVWLAGETYEVLAVVENQGLATAYNACVDIYTFRPGRFPVEPNLLHRQILDLRPGQVVIVRSRNLWTPTLLAGLPDEQVHVLAVHVYDLLNDPIQVPFNPTEDRHVGVHAGTLLAQISPAPYATFAHYPRRLEFTWTDVGGPYHVEIQAMITVVGGSSPDSPPGLEPVTESLPPGWEHYQTWYWWASATVHGETISPEFVWPGFVGAQPGRWRVWSERDPAAKTPWRLFRFEI